MKVDRCERMLRDAVVRAKTLAQDRKAVAEDRYCVPVEIQGVTQGEAQEALLRVMADFELMRGIRKIRNYGLGRWTVEPYPGWEQTS